MLFWTLLLCSSQLAFATEVSYTCGTSSWLIEVDSQNGYADEWGVNGLYVISSAPNYALHHRVEATDSWSVYDSWSYDEGNSCQEWVNYDDYTFNNSQPGCFSWRGESPYCVGATAWSPGVIVDQVEFGEGFYYVRTARNYSNWGETNEIQSASLFVENDMVALQLGLPSRINNITNIEYTDLARTILYNRVIDGDLNFSLSAEENNSSTLTFLVIIVLTVVVLLIFGFKYEYNLSEGEVKVVGNQAKTTNGVVIDVAKTNSVVAECDVEDLTRRRGPEYKPSSM